MPRDLSKRDASDFASSELEYAISTSKKESVKKITAEEAMSKKRLKEAKSDRDITRILFISRNSDLLNPTQQTLDGYVNISELFDEVHVLILREGIPPKYPVLRPAKNVWIYTVSTKYWWQSISAGMEMVDAELVFANGFRPDLVVARDPFESAILANRIAEKYNRPTQLHVLEDFSTKDFRRKSFSNRIRSFLPRFTVPEFVSVRTQTSALMRLLEKKYAISDMSVLPRYQNYQKALDSEESINLKEQYKPHIFFICYSGKLGYESTFHQVLDAAKFVLKNPRVALIVLGDGPAQGEYYRKAKSLGVERQVVFIKNYKDAVAYFKSGHILIVTDTDSDSEEVALKGAASGIPLILTRTEKRMDTFTHGESAFISEPGNLQALTDRIDDLLNNVELRDRFGENAQAIIRDHFHADPEQYRASYRNSVEKAILAHS